jgi:hypothetical protein
MDSDGHVRQRARKNERALKDVRRRDPVRDVDDVGLGRDPLDDAVAGADEVVLEAEVGQEGDEGGNAASLTASTRPSRSCVAASATTRKPLAQAAATIARPVCGPRADD